MRAAPDTCFDPASEETQRMARLPNLDRAQLKPEDQKFYDAIADSRGGVRGPYGILLHSPDLAACVAHTGSYVRYNLDLPETLRETIILATAREINSQYQFYAHARLARQAGLSEDTIQAIAHGTAPQGLSGDEERLVRYVQELLRHYKVSEATFNAVRDRFGIQKTLEITALVGHYLLVGQILAAFEVELPEGAKPEIPE
jgi:4-carboxymuconolactone decarboxylase